MHLRSQAVLWLVLAAIAAGLLVTGSGLGLASSTETRYAEIAREIHTSGDWVVPTFNGAPHLEKPPFAAWAIAIAYSVFGVKDVVPHIPGILAWLGVVLLIGGAARRLAPPDDPDPRALGRGAALLCALTPMLLFQAYVVETDIWLVLAVTAAGVALLESGRAAGRPALRWTLLLHGALGLGMIVKGPLVLGLVLGAGAVTALLRRDAKFLRPLLHPIGLALFVAVSLPWYLVANARLPGLLDLYVTKRLFGTLAASTDFHPHGPHVIWIPVLFGTVPWIAALPGALAEMRRQGGLLRGPAGIVIPLALAAPILFTFSKSRLLSYGAPALPWVSLLVALGAARSESAFVRRGLTLGAAGLALATVGTATYIVLAEHPSAVVTVVLALAAIAAVGALAWRWRSADPAAAFGRAALVTAIYLLASGVTVVAAPRFYDAERGLWQAVDHARSPGDDLGVLVRSHDDWGLFPFYAGREVRFFGYPQSLAVEGHRAEEVRPANFLPVASLGDWLRSPDRRWLMIRKDQPRAELPAPVFTLAEDEKYAVVTNLPLPPATNR